MLAPEERLYQRLLAGNIEEAVEMAEDYVDEHSALDFYDHVALASLRLAENDRQRSTTDVNYRRQVATTAIGVVREVAEHVEEKSRAGDADSAVAKERAAAQDARILCIAGRTELDGAAAEMVGQALEERGLAARVLPPITVSEGALAQLNLTGVEIICLSYLHAQPQVFARYICRRLKRRSPRLKVVVGYWNAPPQAGRAEDIARQLSADAAVVSIEACVNQIDAWTARRSEGETSATPIATSELERVEALRQLELTSSRDPRLGAAAQRAAQAFEAPIGLVSLIDEGLEPWPGPPGSATTVEAGQQAHREAAICGHVAAVEEVLVAEDVAQDPRFADDPLVLEKGIRFYAGAPLRTASGMVLGALCVIDTEPRAFADEDRGRLQALADELMVDLAREAAAAPLRQAG